MLCLSDYLSLYLTYQVKRLDTDKQRTKQMSKQKWTQEDTRTAIDWETKMQQSVINFAKSKFIYLTIQFEANPTNIELEQAISAQETRIKKLEAKLARWIETSPELLGA